MRLNAIIRNSSTALPPGTDVSMTRGEDRSFEVWVRGLEAGRSLVQLVDTGKANVSDSDAEAYYQKVVTATSDLATVGRITDDGSTTRIAKATIAFAAANSTDWPDKLLRQMWAVLDNGERKCCFAAAIFSEGAIPETLPGDEVAVARVLVTAPTVSAYGVQDPACSATVEESNGTPITGRVKRWSVSTSPDVATIDASSGVLTVLADGAFDVICTVDGISGEAALTVAISTTAATVTVTPTPVTVPLGGTQQLAADVKNAGGASLPGAPKTWESLTPATATVDSTGLVTGLAEGIVIIRCTSGAVYGDASVTSTDGVAALEASIVGGRPELHFIHDIRRGVTSSGGIAQFDDARTTAVNPLSLTPIDANKPSILGTDLASFLFNCDGVAGLMTAANHPSLQGARCLILIGMYPHTPGNFPVALQTDDLASGMIAFAQGDNDLGRARIFEQPGAQWQNIWGAMEPTKIRMWVVEKDAATLFRGRRYPMRAYEYAMTAVSSSNPTRLVVGGNGGLNGGAPSSPVKGRVLLGLGHMPNDSELAAIGVWARDHHRLVGGDRLWVCEGDSITSGGNSGTTAQNVWPYLLDQDAALAAWDVLNVAIGGTGFQGASGLLTDAVRTPGVNAMLDAPSRRSVNILDLWMGTNDIAVLNRTGAQVNADTATYRSAGEGQGWEMFYSEILPRSVPGAQAAFDAARAEVNAEQQAQFGSRFIPITTLVPELANVANLPDGIHPPDSLQPAIAAAKRDFVLAAIG